MRVHAQKMGVDALTQEPAANAAGDTTFPLAENTFPLARTFVSEHVCSGPEPHVPALRSFCFTT